MSELENQASRSVHEHSAFVEGVISISNAIDHYRIRKQACLGVGTVTAGVSLVTSGLEYTGSVPMAIATMAALYLSRDFDKLQFGLENDLSKFQEQFYGW